MFDTHDKYDFRMSVSLLKPSEARYIFIALASKCAISFITSLTSAFYGGK